MFVSSALRRLLGVLALCLMAFVASATPAAARSDHGVRHVAHAHHVGTHHQHVRRHFAGRHLAHRHAATRHSADRHSADRHLAHHRARHVARHSQGNESVAENQKSGGSNTKASLSSSLSNATNSGSSELVMEARHYLGGNPTSRASLWCARFMNMVLERTGHRGTGSDMASSFARYGHPVSGPQVGAIAVMSRRGGGHVGIITGIDARGNPIMISGNNGNRVREAPISRGRIYAYVIPN